MYLNKKANNSYQYQVCLNVLFGFLFHHAFKKKKNYWLDQHRSCWSKHFSSEWDIFFDINLEFFNHFPSLKHHSVLPSCWCTGGLCGDCVNSLELQPRSTSYLSSRWQVWRNDLWPVWVGVRVGVSESVCA